MGHKLLRGLAAAEVLEDTDIIDGDTVVTQSSTCLLYVRPPIRVFPLVSLAGLAPVPGTAREKARERHRITSAAAGSAI